MPGILDVDSFVIRFMAENIPAVGFRMYALVVGEKGEVLGCNAAENSVENERYAVSVEGDSLVITDKTSGKSYKNPLLLEDSFDRGDAYVYKKSPDAPRIYKPAAFEFVANSLKSCVKFKFEYDAPECYDFKKLCASEATVKEVVECELVLNKGSDVITLNYNIINKAKDHRLRLMVASGIVGGVISTDSAFDYAVRTDYDSCILTDSNTHNNETFIEISNGASAMAIYTEGQHEVEYTGEYAVLSVLRCTSYINRNTVTFECIGGETWVVPENQCLREVKGRIGISYGIKRAGAELWSNAKFFRNGFISIPNSFDYKKYSGGRFAVQSAELEKVPSSYTALTDEEDIKMMELLLEKLEDDDDVQNVWHNWENN